MKTASSRDEAIDMAVDECVKNGILAEFLSKHQREVKNMTLTEFNEEVYNKLLYEDGVEDGIKKGKSEGKLEGTLITLRKLHQNGKITLMEAVTESGLSEKEFIQKCEELTIQ